VNGTVLVTGAAGFAGSHLVEHLASDNDVVAWARSEAPPELAPLGRWERIDLLDRDDVRRAIERVRPAAVFHCAGFPHAAGGWSDAAPALAQNVLLTHYLFDALRRAAVHCRVILPGSATVYAASPLPHTEDDPLGPGAAYAVSKLAQEQLGLRAVAEDGLDVILTRSFNHTGPRQSPAFAAPSMARQIALIERGAMAPEIRVGNLDAQRDLMDVRDTVAAYVALMRSGTPGTIYNVASGTARTIRSILDGLIARARVPVTVTTDPARMQRSDIPVLIGDSSRLRNATGWKPVIGLDRMLDDLLDYWRRSATAGAT
jgi:GDP-4-dehydro-6-deoxy-D-mannose reductase